ncbi:Polyhomeotic-like protein 2 [Galemys pyrenaicus]|uniref:Polyhomeotic-like protein 2 n=1 Tax=Galemys pyrenaicus TaxID=202257 RepID=A0A8J6DXX1_GALPY|nr:Polyhomeotic-like protein 2 [Galemys pyrenaicus]
MEYTRHTSSWAPIWAYGGLRRADVRVALLWVGLRYALRSLAWISGKEDLGLRSSHRRPRRGLAPLPPFVDARRAGAVECAAAAPGPGSEAPGGEEAARPGPGPRARMVGRLSLLVGNLKKKYAQGFLPEKLPQQDHTTTTDSEMEEPYLQESKEEGTPLKLKCELCGRVDFAYKFKRSKRFCSMACAKRYNVGCTKRVGLFHSDRSKLQKTGATTHNRRRASKASLPTLTKDTKKQPTGTVPLSVTAALQLTHSQEDSSRCSDNSSYEEPLSPISASSSTSRRRQGQRDLELPDMHMRDLVGMGHHFLPSEPTKWNVEDGTFRSGDFRGGPRKCNGHVVSSGELKCRVGGTYVEHVLSLQV